MGASTAAARLVTSDGGVLEAVERAATRPATARFAIADRILDRLDVDDARRGRLLGELATAAVLEHAGHLDDAAPPTAAGGDA